MGSRLTECGWIYELWESTKYVQFESWKQGWGSEWEYAWLEVYSICVGGLKQMLAGTNQIYEWRSMRDLDRRLIGTSHTYMSTGQTVKSLW